MRAFDSNIELQVLKTVCDSTSRLQVLSQITPEHFGADESREILNRVLTLISAGKAAPSSEVLKHDHALTDASRALLSSPVARALTSEDDITAALEILNKYRKARVLLQTVTSAIEALRDDNPDVDAVVSSMEASLMTCHSGTSKEEMSHITVSRLAELQQEVSEMLDSPDDDLIPTGFREFDKRTGGFRRKNVIAIASTPGGGKSAMMNQMAANQYRMGYNVCVLSYEMDDLEIKNRILSNISRVSHSDVNLRRLSPQQRALVEKRWAEFIKSSGSNNRFTIWCPTMELNVPEIAVRLKPMGYDIVYIDYVSLLKQDPKKQMWEALGDHARNSKLMANNLACAVVLLCQYDDETNRLKYSKAIQANAHFVWAWENTDKERESGMIEVKQLKARNAEVYTFTLQRNFTVMEFKDPVHGPPVVAMVQQHQPVIPKMPELSGP